jgi:hypothetical protein
MKGKQTKYQESKAVDIEVVTKQNLYHLTKTETKNMT